MTVLEQMGQNAKQASRFLLTAGQLKNKALLSIADALIENCDEIVKANSIDIQIARENNTKESLIDRLSLSPERIKGMAEGVRQVAALPDPTGVVLSGETRPNGLKIEKVRVPLGVIGIIYEARPNVTSDAAALCLKSGNAVILRGGKEAITDVLPRSCETLLKRQDCLKTVSHLYRIHQELQVLSLCNYPIILMYLSPVVLQDLSKPL